PPESVRPLLLRDLRDHCALSVISVLCIARHGSADVAGCAPMEATIRDAKETDVPFISWVQQEAARSHLPLGFWDLAFPGAEADRLRIVGRICKAKSKSFCHWSGFLIA